MKLTLTIIARSELKTLKNKMLQDAFAQAVKNGRVKETDGIIHLYNDEASETLCVYDDSKDIVSEELLEIGGEALWSVIKEYPQSKKTLEVTLNIHSATPETKTLIERGVVLASLHTTFKSKDTTPAVKITNTEERNTHIAHAIHTARVLTGTPANKLTPESFVKEIKKLDDKDHHTKVTLFEKHSLEKEKMNLFLAVNQGSKDPAVMTMIDYNPPKADNTDEPIILVGKGLMYDSGGYYMKPAPYMNDMYGDMGGAANVVAILELLHKIKYPRRVIGFCGITESMVDALSFRNGDIITSRKGLTVEIKHTDAEGRLVLADILDYASTQFTPAIILDMATLTGACHNALGELYTGIFSENKAILETLMEAGSKTGDQAWPLPIDNRTRELVQGDKSDLINTSKIAPVLWASTAASFLEHFVTEPSRWVHLDIAGPALRTSQRRSYDTKGLSGSGGGVALVTEFLEMCREDDFENLFGPKKHKK